MPSGERKLFQSTSLTPEAIAAVRAAGLRLTGPAGRRVSASDVIITALAVADDHEDEWVAKLAGKD